MKKTLVSVILAIMLIVSSLMVVPFTADAMTSITNPADANGYSYTNSSELATRLNAVFNGDIGMYADADCTSEVQLALGQSLNNSTTYYVKSNATGTVSSGKQCFVYANAVYNRLFNEWVGGLATSFTNSQRVIDGGASSVSYEMFNDAGVRCGAYLRTTNQSTGEYNGYSGHSMLVLSYDESEIVILDGNSDGKGLIRITVNTWDEFNANHFTRSNRYLCYVVQPTDTYYNTLFSVTHNHDWVIEIKEATCTESGAEIHKCKECGLVEKTEVIPALSHNWSGWRVTDAATCTEDGIQTNTCKNCGETETKSISATGHNWGDWLTVIPAQDDTAGLETRICKKCATIETNEIPALSFLKGDANGDGRITAIDARIALQIAAGLNTPTDEMVKLLDMNDDGKVSAVDARTVLQIAAGIETV